MYKVYLFMVIFTIQAYANSDKNIATITQNIACTSQKIACDYLYFYYTKGNKIYKKRLQNSIQKLEDDFRELAKDSNDANTKDILEFLSYSKDKMKDMLNDKISKENLEQMLDYSDTLLEGVESVLNSNDYNLSIDKKYKLELLKTSTLYMKKNLELESKVNLKLDFIDQRLQNEPLWQIYKSLINKKDIFLPNIILTLTQSLEEQI